MAPVPEPVLSGFNPTLLLVLNLAGTFVFGLSGGMAGVRARLDVFGAMLLGVVVGIAGGTIRDLLIGIPPATFRDWRYLAVAGGAGVVVSLARPAIDRFKPAVEVLDAAGLALFCVTGASTALVNRVGAAEAVILGATTGIGGGMLRDVLIGEIPSVLRGGLYAIPALMGAAIVAAAYQSGDKTILFPLIGAAVCFMIRMAGLIYGLQLPGAADLAITQMPRLRRRKGERANRGSSDDTS